MLALENIFSIFGVIYSLTNHHTSYNHLASRLLIKKNLPKHLRETYWVRKVKAALVIDVGRLRPLVISLHIFLLITSTRPPFSVTSL